jgi:hypothetical protein
MKKLTYQIEGYSHIYNDETEEVEKRLSLSTVTVENPTDADVAKAKKNAYNGEYHIEDDGQPEEPETLTVWDELDAAYQEGVDSV